MNLIHIGDTSGVASITSNICNKIGCNSSVLNLRSLDKYGFSRYYKNTYLFKSVSEIKRKVKQNSNKIDHIVYHNAPNIAIDLDYLHIPSSYMFHGRIDSVDPKIPDIMRELESIDNIFVSNESLLHNISDSELLCSPVDMDLFRPLNLTKKDLAFSIIQKEFKYDIYEFIHDRDSDLGLISLDSNQSRIYYGSMPLLLNSHKYYVDLRFNRTEPCSIVREMSSIGRQALACGIPVLSYNGWNYTLSPSYYDENVVTEFLRVILE